MIAFRVWDSEIENEEDAAGYHDDIASSPEEAAVLYMENHSVDNVIESPEYLIKVRDVQTKELYDVLVVVEFVPSFSALKARPAKDD